LKKYERIWRLHWVPFCQQRGKDPQEYNVINFVNFLNATQEASEAFATSKNKTAQHGTYKERCAAISGCFELKYPDKQRLSMHPHTRGMSASNRRTAPNVPKYFELPDITNVLEIRVQACRDFIHANGSYAGFFSQMPILQLRDESMFLTRMEIGNRSQDLSVINRVWEGSYAGLRGNQGRCEISHIRYDFPKNWHSRVRMSEWISMGQFQHQKPGFEPEFHALCAKSAMQTYYRRTVSLPIKPTSDKDHPNEVKTRLFISVIKQDRKINYVELRSNTIAKRIRNLLEAGGIDISKFQSHILRHVSINSQVAMGKDLDEVLSRACVSSKVYSMYYKLPFNASTASAPEAVMFENPDRENQDPTFELLTEQTSTSTATSSTSTSRSALRVSNAGGGRKRRRGAAATAVT